MCCWLELQKLIGLSMTCNHSHGRLTTDHVHSATGTSTIYATIFHEACTCQCVQSRRAHNHPTCSLCAEQLNPSEDKMLVEPLHADMKCKPRLRPWSSTLACLTSCDVHRKFQKAFTERCMQVLHSHGDIQIWKSASTLHQAVAVYMHLQLATCSAEWVLFLQSCHGMATGQALQSG